MIKNVFCKITNNIQSIKRRLCCYRWQTLLLCRPHYLCWVPEQRAACDPKASTLQTQGTPTLHPRLEKRRRCDSHGLIARHRDQIRSTWPVRSQLLSKALQIARRPLLSCQAVALGKGFGWQKDQQGRGIWPSFLSLNRFYAERLTLHVRTEPLYLQ